MKSINRRSLLKSSAALSAAASMPRQALAQAQPAYTPDDLKSVLTPLGGLRAGNADGSIPAWTGELLPFPDDYVSGQIRPDLFASEQPIASINAANMTDHKDRLTPGYMKLMETYPDYKILVYPTHRTGIAPQYIYDYTYKNATTAKLSDDENTLTGAYGGAPFPIPTTGKQVMWNHLLRWCGVSVRNPSGNYQVTASGEVILRNYSDVQNQWPYYFEGRENEFKGIYQQVYVADTEPAYVEGESVVLLFSVNPLQNPAKAWQYLLGERRVRLAPQLVYDTPIDLAGDLENWDEPNMFSGALDEYDCKIVGKKEIYVPYNCNRMWATPITQALGPHFANTDAMRFELHRVWVIEMTLADGRRNVDARRTMYVDEDTWLILTEEIYDASGAIWKHFQAVPLLCSDFPMHGPGDYFYDYDFHSQSYVMSAGTKGALQWQKTEERPESFYTAGQLAARAGGN